MLGRCVYASLALYDIQMFILTDMTHAWQMCVCASLALYDIHMFILTGMTHAWPICVKAYHFMTYI